MSQCRRSPVATGAVVVALTAAAVAERRGAVRDDHVPIFPAELADQVARSAALQGERHVAEPAPDAELHRVTPSEPARFTLDYDFGGFWMIAGDGGTTERDDLAAIDGTFEHRAGAWASGNSVSVKGCCQAATARIEVVLLRAAPVAAAAAGADAATELDVDARGGRLLVGTNPDPASRLVEVPAGRYRARIVARTLMAEPWPRERFRVLLWRSPASAPPAVLRRRRQT